jgi:hypothetical protein
MFGIISMSIYIYSKSAFKNNYGIINLAPLILIIGSALLLILNQPIEIHIGAITILLFSINILYNPYVNSLSKKLELLLVLLLAFIYINQSPNGLISDTKSLIIVSIFFALANFYLERNKLTLACMSQISIHLLLMTKASPLIFLYSLVIVFISWSIFEYISRDNNDFISKIILLLFVTDLPFTPYFYAKYKIFSNLYIENEWGQLTLVILYSLIITVTIILYSYKSIILFAKNEAQTEKTSTIIYFQRIAITLFFLIYTLSPLILFKQ